MADSGLDATGASSNDTVVHMLRVHDASDGTVSSAVTPAIGGLTYHGGPLLTHVDVHPVFWNSATRLQSNLNAFYAAIVTSPLFTMLAQYGIGFGTPHNGIVDTKTTTNVRDSAIQTELSNLINAGKLPAPTANTYYPVHFPVGVTITAPDGSQSCVVFCAYHSVFVRNGVNVVYGVIPDVGSGGCAGGCGTGTFMQNTDSVASHELVEAVTDPVPPTGWFDQLDGAEIGDLCNAQQGSIPRVHRPEGMVERGRRLRRSLTVDPGALTGRGTSAHGPTAPSRCAQAGSGQAGDRATA